MNNREIKFRVWNNKNKTWIHGPNEIADLDGVNLFGETILFGGFMGGVSIKDLNDCIPLQYTGLKDKNGKEIYEGDLIRMGSDIAEIKFKDGMFGIDWLDDSYEMLIFCPLSQWKFIKKEVVGNIFENPELLTTETITPTNIVQEAHEEYLKSLPKHPENGGIIND